MNYFLRRLQTDLSASIQSLFDTELSVAIEEANPKVGADLAIPCFVFAKELHQNPQLIARKIAESLQHDSIDKVEATAGFVNIWLKPSALAQCFGSDLLHAADEKLQYGEVTDGKGETAIVEFPSPNMAKPFGAGHLRPANQGWAIHNLMKVMGYTVVTDNHLGDWGTPFGKWAVGFTHYSSEEKLAQDGIYELARVYIKVTAELKFEAEHNKHELADEVQDWLVRLEGGDAKAVALSRRFNEISLEHQHYIMGRLKIHTDEELGESFYIAEGKRMVQDLVKGGIAIQQEDGSVIVPLDEYGIETPILIQKSNGAALYATSDLATLKYRWERWHPKKVIYLVGSEQQFHFMQVFALADKLGYKTEYQHIWWGMIDQVNEDGSRSKMSSRKGTILLEELLDQAETHAQAMISENETRAVSKEDVQKIALGAIKFADFAQDRRTGILFDWNRMFSLKGYSGPYVQYAGVRIHAILKKLGSVTERPFDDDSYDWATEKELLMRLVRYPQILRDAADLYEPHRVAQFTYELARALNRYYEEVSISDSPVAIRPKRLWLLERVGEVHAHALNVLGIEVPESM
jgi:arginyl-tRNA synthetase